MPAPVALFAYNRPEHTRRTLAALLANELAAQTDLIAFSDGAANPSAQESVQQVRKLLRAVHGFRSVRLVERESNLGLARSIISGVTEVCGEYGRVIVLEDDIESSPHFLRYMNDALGIYAEEGAVGSIHAYWYPVDGQVPDTFFLRGASCWGWATWSRSWQHFEPDGRKLLAELRRRKLEREFDLDGSMAYTRMLEDQIAGRNNSWAIRWHATNFLAGKLQLYSGRSLVRNIGFDGSGTHSGESEAFQVELAMTPVTVRFLQPEVSAEARAALVCYYRRTRRTLFMRIRSRLRRILRG